MSDEKEYEFNGSFEIGFSGECMGKLKLSELKAKLKKEIEEFLEKEGSVASYDVWQFETDIDYEDIS
jgi:hypothetical protein